MIILDKPYVSDFLIETIKKNGFDVLDNEISRKYFDKSELTSSQDAIEKYKNGELFYTNSENSISWIDENLKGTQLSQYIEISKNKALFRQKISPLYPDYRFFEMDLEQLKSYKPEYYPFILKPSVGFLSFGVYPIRNEKDWSEVVLKIDNDIQKLKDIFPNSVVDMTKFILEDMIEGREFALDAYYDENGEAVILNISFQSGFNCLR